MSDSKTISPDFLALLRCPEAVHDKSLGADAGKLTLVKETWLVCESNGNKYPILDGIPVMLIEEGRKWRDTSIEDLPVPPPSA